MSRILIATLYKFEPVIASATKISAEILYLLIDREPDEKQSKSLSIIKQSLGAVLKLNVVRTDIYDIVKVAEETVRIIDSLSDKDEVYVDISSGRKPKVLGLLFGAYARSDMIKRVVYVREENNQIMELPKLSYNLTSGQRKILVYLSKNRVTSMNDFADSVDVSRAMLYRHIKELKSMGIIEETPEGLKLTDYGRIALL